jgi:hypothetical protein
MSMDHENIWAHKKFPNPLDPNEKILLILRKDNTVLKRELSVGFFLIIILFCIKLILQNSLSWQDNSAWFYFVNMSYYTLICLLMLQFAFFCHNYFLSFWAFTPLRIIGYTQNNLFQADVNSIWYKNIEKVELKFEKATHTLNDYGDIVLKMKGEGEQKDKIVLSNLPSPKYIFELITTLTK